MLGAMGAEMNRKKNARFINAYPRRRAPRRSPAAARSERILRVYDDSARSSPLNDERWARASEMRLKKLCCTKVHIHNRSGEREKRSVARAARTNKIF